VILCPTQVGVVLYKLAKCTITLTTPHIHKRHSIFLAPSILVKFELHGSPQTGAPNAGLFCSLAEGWPQHGRRPTFSIYLCPVILFDSSTGSPVHVLMLSIQAVRGLSRLRAPGILFIALSLSPARLLLLGNSIVSSWCDRSLCGRCRALRVGCVKIGDLNSPYLETSAR